MLPWQQWSSTQYLIACKICGIFWKGVLEPLTHVFTDLRISKESNFLIQVIVMWSGSTLSSESFSARRLRKQLQSAHIPPLVPKKLGSKRSHFNVQHPLLVLPLFLLLLLLKDCGCCFSLVILGVNMRYPDIKKCCNPTRPKPLPSI